MTTTAPNPVKAGLFARFPLICYFIIAVIWSWIVVIVHVVFGLPTTALTIVLITMGPFVAGFVMQAILNGREGVLHLLKRLIRVKVNWVWYLLVLVGVPLFLVAGTIVLPGALASMNLAGPDWLAYTWQFVMVALIAGPLLEEPGWRGFALPRLEAKFGYWGPLVGTLILGVIWALWHFPQYMMPDWAAQNGGFSIQSMLIYIASVIPMTIILSWVYNVTRGSLFMVVLAHASINAFSGFIIGPLFPVGTDSLVNGFIGFGGAALIVIILTRGRLGFDRYLREVPVEERRLDGTEHLTPRLGEGSDRAPARHTAD